ncbi:MAG: hypothetical protein ACRDIV_01675, partial [Ktedonobacteraceae bacterium]
VITMRKWSNVERHSFHSKILFAVIGPTSSITSVFIAGQTRNADYIFVIFQNTIFIDFSEVTVYNKKR